MKSKRLAVRAAALLGAAGLWWGAYRAMPAAEAPTAEPAPLWVLRDDGGRLAQYDYDALQGPPVQTWPVYTALLPQTDLERLRDGIPVYSAEELRRLVEDLGG